MESWLNVLLYLGFMIIIVLMGASLFITINSASSIKQLSQELHNRQINQTVSLLKLEQNLTLSFSQLSTYLIAGKTADKEKFINTLDKVIKGINNSLDGSNNSKAQLEKISTMANLYQNKSREVIEITSDRSRNYIGIFKAAELLNPLYLEFIGIMEQLIDDEMSKGDDINIELLASLVKTRSSWYRMIMSLRVYFTTRGELDFQQFNLYRQQNDTDIAELSLLKEQLEFDQFFIDELVSIRTQYIGYLPEVLSLYKDEKWRYDIYMLKTEIFPLMSSIHSNIREIVEASEKLTTEHMNAMQLQIDDQVHLTQWILIISITLGVTIVLIVGRNVSQIVQSLARSKREASENLIKAEERAQELELTSLELKQSFEILQETQSQLIESEKMAALGGLVAGVAHEINTPIGIGITSSSFLSDLFRDIQKLYDNKNMSEEDFENFIHKGQESTSILNVNLQRAAELIRSFKQIAVDQSSEELRDFDLNIYLDEIILSLRPKLKKKSITIQKNCPDSLVLKSYPGVYSQIFTNLILNSITHGFEQKEQGNIVINVEPLEENHNSLLSISYSDDGIGVTPEVKKKIFEPFYTTKRNSGGSGIGMSLVYNLVTQKLCGKLSMESEQGRGISFNIIVPKDIETEEVCMIPVSN